MKKVLKKFNRTLSIMLAAAMVLTMVPQTAMPVLAAEVETEATVTPDTPAAEETVVGNTGETPENPAENEQETENGEGDGEASGDNNTPVIDPIENPSENPAEDPVEDPTEVPAENPTEDPEEGEVAAPDINDDKVTIMEAGDGAGIPVTFPAESERVGYTITAAATATAGEDYSFTVTAAAGYDITDVKYTPAGGSATAADGTAPNYKIPGTAITEGLSGITITVTATKKQYNLTVKVDEKDGASDATNLTSISYSAGEVTDAAISDFMTPIKITHGDTLSLKVVPKTDYEVQVKKGTAPVSGGADNVYTVGEVTGDVVINITTSKNKFAVTEDITKGGTPEAALAVIAYEKNCVVDGKIAKGTNLAFQVNPPTTGANFEGKKVIVSYKVGADGVETELTADNKSKVYTVAAARIRDDITIKVVVRDKANFTVSLAKSNEHVKTVEYSTATPDVWQAIPAGGASVVEESTVRLKVTADTYYKVTAVKVDGTTLQLKSGVYSFVADKNAEVAVETALDPSQCSSFTYKLTGDPGSVTASISVSENNIELEKRSDIKSGEAQTISGNAVVLDLVPKTGYKITKVDNVANEKAANEPLQYRYEIPTKGKRTVTVTTAPVANENRKVVSFDNQAEHMSYKVTGDRKVTVSGNDCVIGEGAERLQFTVTAAGPYAPTVKRGETEVSYTSIKGAAYSYVIPASTLTDKETITIIETVIEHAVTLKEDYANTDIVASVDGKKRNADDGSTDKYTLKENETIALQIKAKTGYKLVSVTSQVGTAAAKTVAPKNGVVNLEVKVSDEASVSVKTEEIYLYSGLKQNGVELKPADAKKNSYNVSYDGTYTIDVTKGASTPAALTDVKVFSGRNEVAEATEGTGYATVSGGTATIDLSKAKEVAGKNGLTVKLYVAGEEQEDGTTPNAPLDGTWTLNVSALVKDIKINNKSTLEVKQALDTMQTYKVTAAKGVELSKLAVTTTDASGILADSGVSYNAAAGTLTVVTKAAKPTENAKAEIVIHENGKNGADDPKATLTIAPVELVPKATKAPGVKLVAATDVSFRLALSTAVKENPVSGKLYYKVETQEVTVAGKTVTPVENTKKTAYVEKKGLSQEADITVRDGGLGSGTEVKTYEVKASLVHFNKETENGAPAADNVVLGESDVSKAQNIKTQIPAYEDKLKLKKGRTTLATGEKAVVVATPQFSKYATYLSLAASDTVKDLSYRGDEALTFVTPTSDDNYAIKATATANTALGKHKVQVTASAETGAEPSVATIDVTVVRGIHQLNVEVPSTNLYKANKKAATLKAKAVYNTDATGKNKEKQPKNKKVDWAVVAVGADGNVQKNDKGEDVLFAGASAKNGSVTVDKNYIIAGDYTDQFKIRVTAQNTDKSYAGKTDDGKSVVGYSELITITNEGENIKGLAIVKEVSEPSTADDPQDPQPTEKKYEIVAAGGTAKSPVKLEAGKLEGCSLAVLGSTATSLTAGTKVTEDQMLTYTNFAVKCTQKGLLQDNGKIGAVSKMGKATFTATANDGSKKKADLVLEIQNDNTKEKALSLKVEKALYTANGAMATEANGVLFSPNTAENAAGATAASIAFDGSTTPLVALTLVTADAESATADWATAPKYANYKLTVSGGGKIVEKGITTYVAITKTTDVVVTLEDPVNSTASNKIKKTFTLKNGGKTVAPKFTAGKLKSVGKFSEQTTDIKVENMTAAVEDITGLKAKVEVDWSAASAKNQTDLQAFQSYLEDNYAVEVTTDTKTSKKIGKIALALKGTADETVTLPQSSYKLKITLGTVTDNVFTAVTLPIAVTVKVDRAKAFTFTPTVSYTLFTKDRNASAPLTGRSSAKENEYTVTYKSDDTDLSMLGLRNANVKGATNDFTEYFEISSDGKNIQLKSGKSIPKTADLTGYLTYQAVPSVGYYTLGKGAGINTVKITIKFNESKTADTYVQKKANNQPTDIAKEAGSTADVEIQAKAGKVLSDAKLALVAVGTDNTSKLFSASVKTSGSNTVTLTYNGTEPLKKGTKYTVKLYLLPSDSWYKSEIENKENADDKAKAIIEKNIVVSVQLKAVDAVTPMDQAKQKLSTWLAAQSSTKAAWLKNGLISADLLTKIAAADGGAGLAAGVSVAIAKKTTDASADDYDNTTKLATVTEAGEISGTFEITIAGESETKDTLAFKLTVPAGAITKDEAETAIKGATGVTSIAVTSEDISDTDKKAAKEKAITDAAQAALGGDTYYTVTVKSSAGLTESSGNATITLEIKETGNTGDTAKEVALTYTVSS